MCRTSAQLAGALRLCFVLLICCVSAAFAKDESWSRWVCVNKNEIEECVQEDPCKTAYRGKIECYVENTKVSDRVCENAKLPRPKPSTAACESRISDVTISFINETTAEVAYIVPDPTVTVQSGDFVFILTDLSYFVATPSLSCSAPVKCVVDGMSIRATMPTSHSSLSRTVFYVYGVLLGGSLDARISIRVHHSHAPMWNLYYGTNAHLGLLRISTYHPDFSSAHLVSTGTARYIAIFAQNDPDVPFVPDTIRSVVFTVGPLSVDPSAPRPGNALRPTYTRGVPTKSLIVEHCSASWREKGGNAWFISDGVSPPAVWRFTAARGHEFQLPSRSLVSGVAIFCRISPPPQVENSPGPAPSADDIDFVFSSVPIAVWLRAVDGSLFAPSTAPQRSLSASRGGDEHYVFVMSPLFRGEAPKPLRNLDSVLQTPTWISANGPRMTVAFQLEAEKRPLGAAFLAQGLSAPLMNYLNSTYLPGIAEATMEYPAYYGPYGTWVCSSNGKPAACVFSNGCGQTTSPVMCMIGGQPSLLGDAPCAWSPLPSSTLGCGAFRCRNGRGNFVPCDDKTLCFPGCDDIPRTVSKEHHGVAPFIPVCVLNGKEVDPDAFCPSHLVQPEFPASCLSRDDCTEACFDIDGLYTSCDNRNSWSLCNPVSKSDNRTVEIQQLACIDKNAPDLRTTPIFPYSFCTGAYPSEWREPPERPCTIYSCMSALREFRWLCSISEDQKEWTACGPDNWAPCSSDCGEGTAQRDYTCGEVNCKGDVVQVGVRDSFCAFKPTPEKTKRCERRECTNHVWMCSDPVKGGSELTPCETAELECPLCTEGGELVRTVVCQLKDTQTTLDDSQCKGARPVAARICPASKKTCSVDFTSKTCSASALGTPEIGLNVTAGIDCLPQNGNIPEIFKVGDCVDELGRPVPRKLCSESLVKKCDLPVCESRPLWMCAREGGGFLEATECTDKSTFACPESDCGCTTVRRSVLCMLDSLVVDDRLCTDVRPSSSFRCPLRTSACKASFDTPTMCFAHTVNNFGESETKNFTKCIPPELALEATISASCYSPTLATTGCKGCGIACPPPVSDFGFNRVYVPQEWCGSLTEPRRCPLPICESPAYTLAWDVEEGACVDDDDHCSSYAKNIIRCVALEGNSTAFEVPDASCDASTRPPLFTPCPGRALCAFGKCMTSPLDDFGHASNSTVTVRVGKCRCDPGYFGPSCDQTFQLARTWMVPAIEDYAAGNLRIAWDVTHADALGTAAVSANAINSSFSTYFAFAPATDGSVALPVSELLSFLKPGPVVFIVTIGGLSLNVTADLPPLCAPLLNKPCSNHGFCNSVTSKCDCTDGYAGDQCQLSLCEAKQCNPQHSSCFVEDNVANCGCARSLSLALFADSRCNELIDCAHTRVCQNGATHAGVLLDGKVVCAGCFCQNRFVGPTCSSCGLHGVCVNGRPNQECSKCVCDSGFFGPICDCHFIFITVLFSQTSEASRLSRTLNGKSLSRWLNGLAKAVQVVSGLRHVSLNYNSSQHLKTDSDNEMGGAYFEVTFRVDYPCSIPEPTPERLHSASVMSGPSGKAVSDDLNRVRDALFSNELRRLPPFEGLDPFAGVSFAEPACDEAYGECPRDVGGGAVPVKIVPPITPEPEPRPTKRKSLTGLEISIIMLCIILIPCFCVIIYLGIRSCREDSRKQEPVQLSPRVTASAPVEKNTFNENPTS